MEKSSTTKYFLIAELGRKKMHGYELMNRLAVVMGKKPSPSQIYPVLNRMKSMGYVTVRTKLEGKKKVKYYTLTKSGNKFYETMNNRFEFMIKAALKEKIKVCAHCSCEMIGHTYMKKIGGKLHHFCCPPCAASYVK